jgi:hypothetical protein
MHARVDAQVTRGGVDRLMQAFLNAVDNVLLQTGNDPSLFGPDFALWVFEACSYYMITP